MLVRCPEGYDKECFHQKHPSHSVPESVGRVPIREKNATLDYMFVEDAVGLVGLVQIGALEIHSWGSRIDRLEYPDQLVFDLDPDEGLPWQRMIDAAHDVRERLAAIGLHGFLKTTGGKGLHVVVPIEPRTGWDDAKQFCKSFVEGMVRAAPGRYLASMSKAKRKGKIFLDYLRNGRGSTAVCAYSTRARAGAPVSMPIAWEDLTAKLRPDAFDLRNTPKHVAARAADPWRDFDDARAAIRASAKRSVGMR
jgi:bifunctional non-homologous end joining protein LigD